MILTTSLRQDSNGCPMSIEQLVAAHAPKSFQLQKYVDSIQYRLGVLQFRVHKICRSSSFSRSSCIPQRIFKVIQYPSSSTSRNSDHDNVEFTKTPSYRYLNSGLQCVMGPLSKQDGFTAQKSTELHNYLKGLRRSSQRTTHKRILLLKPRLKLRV